MMLRTPALICFDNMVGAIQSIQYSQVAELCSEAIPANTEFNRKTNGWLPLFISYEI